MMNLASAEAFLSHKLTWFGLAATALLFYVVANLPWELDDYDQGQQAFSSYEMVKEGHWFYQRTPHQPIAQKPPLVGCMSAALYSLTRCWNVSWRLPSLLSAYALMIVLYRGARSSYGAVPALVATSAFAFNLLTVRLATMVRTDMPLALSIFLLGFLIFQKIRRQEPWRARDRWLFFIILTCSLWIKGPFAYLFVLPPVVIFLWRFRNSGVIGAWCGWWPWAGALLLFACWVGGGILLIPDFYHQIVGFEFLDRLDPSVHHAQPVYFYLPHLLHKCFPWSALVFVLAALLIRRVGNIRRAAATLSPAMFWLVAWTATGLIVMSLVPSKRVDRVFAIVPPLSLLLAAQMARVLAIPELKVGVTRWAVIALAVALVFSGGYAGFKVFSGYHEKNDALVRFSSRVQATARQRNWRYEIVKGKVSGRDGMLLYLDKLHFVNRDRAAALWSNGEVDALVVPREKLTEMMAKLPGAGLSPLHSPPRAKQFDYGYAFVVRNTALLAR